MNSDAGFEIHPLAGIFFFRSVFPPEELNDASIFLTYTHKDVVAEGVFKLHAWRHPELPEFAAMKATADTYKDGQPAVLTLTFDASRATLVRKVDSLDFKFRADLGELEPPQQVPEIWEAVQREFAAAARQIDLKERGQAT